MKPNDLRFWSPLILGLAGCFLPYAAYHIPPEWFTPSIAGNYTGWGTVAIIVLFGIFSFIRKKQQKSMPALVDGLVGFYLLGLTLFRLYHTLLIFKTNNANNLAADLKVSAWPREGLFLLMAAGIWLLARAFGRRI